MPKSKSRSPLDSLEPLEPKVRKETRKALAKELRARLSQKPLGVAEMAEELDVEPEVVVVALRELRSRKRGRLRSTIERGHTAWSWEEAPKREKKAK